MNIKQSFISLSLQACTCSILLCSGVHADPSSMNRARMRSDVETSDVVDMTVASVDGQPILLSELKATLKQSGKSISKEADIFSEVSLQALHGLVQDRIIRAEAESLGVSVSEQDIDGYQEEVRARSGLPKEEFFAELTRQGLDLTDYRKQIRNQILQSRVVTTKVRNKLTVTDSDVEKYIAEFPERKPRAGQIRLIEIAIPRTIPQAELEYSRLKNAIESGHRPQEVAKQYFSDLGYVDPTELREDYIDALKDLPLERVSKPIFFQDSIHALYIASRADDQGLDPGLKREIKDYLFEKNFQKEADRYLREELPKAHDVEILIGK